MNKVCAPLVPTAYKQHHGYIELDMLSTYLPHFFTVHLCAACQERCLLAFVPVAWVTDEHLLVLTHSFANVDKLSLTLLIQVLLLLATTGTPGIDLQVGPVLRVLSIAVLEYKPMTTRQASMHWTCIFIRVYESEHIQMTRKAHNNESTAIPHACYECKHMRKCT